MDSTTVADRIASEKAYRDRHWAYDDMRAEAATGGTLLVSEHELLRDILVLDLWWSIHSGNGQDDIALLQAGARTVIGAHADERAHATRTSS